MHRINVLGASGCGASTLGRALSAALSVPHFDCDDYFHEPADPPYTVPCTPRGRHSRIEADLGRAKRWVLSGGVAGWVPYPQLDFSLIVFLWVPAAVRIERLRRRERERFGQRVLEGGDMHAGHEAFIDWASRYDSGDVDGKTLARHEAYLAVQSCPVLEFRGALPLRQTTRDILASLA